MSNASKYGYASENRRRKFVRGFIKKRWDLNSDLVKKENNNLYSYRKSGLDVIREKLKEHPNLTKP